jgi:ribosomal protein L4
MQVDVINMSKEKVSTIELPDEVFAAEVNEVLMWEQVKV